MDISTVSLELGHAEYLVPVGAVRPFSGSSPHRAPSPTDPDSLRQCAWEIGERHPAARYQPPTNHVGLAMVHPCQGFAYWHILPAWVDEIARQRGNDWDGSRPVLRLYDVSYIHFTGLNAHRIQDEHLPHLAGQRFFNVPNPGTYQIAEVGFLLKNGEFIPAARSPLVPFAPDAPSHHHNHAALLVRPDGRVEEIGNVWNQEQELRERRRPHLRHPLRLAAFTFAARAAGHDDNLATFVTELAQGQRAHGHEVHVFLPATQELREDREIDGVHYHPLPGIAQGDPLGMAKSFARAAEQRLSELPPFDLIHLHEWMTGLGSWVGHRPTVLSLSSIEATRRADRPADELSREIELIEQQIARAAGVILTPDWLRERTINEFELEANRVHPFALEGRLANEWECPLDTGHVKMNFGMGPLDRMLLFIGPLEHAAGVDLLVEALPVLLRRWGNLRVGFVGNGPMQGHLERRAGELGVHWAVRFLGHQSGQPLVHLLRSCEAVVLPSRYRIAMDDAVVDLARKAGRAVVTTQGGPSYLVQHEHNGLVTYDNPGSMVWALDRVMGDPGHAERMGANGRRYESGTPRWSEVARYYLEGCLHWFPELTVTRM